MPANAGNTTYFLGLADGTGWRELDILPMIVDQDPRDRPFFELSGTSEAKSVLHQWQVRGVPTRATNAIIEGADFTFTDVAGPVRLTNTCQILTQGVEITGSSRAEGHYGVADIFRDQVNYKAELHGLDMEFNLIRATLTTGGTAAARKMRGLIALCTTASYGAANVLTQNGATLTEAIYIQGIEQGWNQGAKVNTVLAPSKQIKIIDTFNGQGQTKWTEAKTREIVNQVLIYHSSFGTVENHLCRDLSNASTTGEIVMFDKSSVYKAWLRTTKLIPVAKTADADRLAMVSELTLEVRNPESLVYLYQLASPN